MIETESPYDIDTVSSGYGHPCPTNRKEPSKKNKESSEKKEALEESNTSQQAATSLWMTYMNPATGRNFMSKPKLGTWIYNPATGESKEYEGE